MEAANRGAHDIGEASIGMGITLPHEEIPNSYISPKLCFRFDYFSSRKMHFMQRARAIMVFPGGLGTLDELFETLTLRQTSKTPAIPIVLFDRNFWSQLLQLDVLVQEGLIAATDLQLFQFADSAEEAWQHICQFYQQSSDA